MMYYVVIGAIAVARILDDLSNRKFNVLDFATVVLSLIGAVVE